MSSLNNKYYEEKSGFPCCAAAAKSLQSCPTLCYPIDGSPPDSPVPGILQARILEWVAISRKGKEMRMERIITEGK